MEQPVGTGFSQGKPDATSEADVAREFLGFFKNFVDLFDLHNRKVFIAGESYAGYYVPYIADAMLNANDTKFFGVNSIMIYDPSTSTDTVQEESKSLYRSARATFDNYQYPLWRSSTTGQAFSRSILPSWTISTNAPTPAATQTSSIHISHSHLQDLCHLHLTRQLLAVMSGPISTMPRLASILASIYIKSQQRVLFCGMSSAFRARSTTFPMEQTFTLTAAMFKLRSMPRRSIGKNVHPLMSS